MEASSTREWPEVLPGASSDLGGDLQPAGLLLAS